MTRPGSLPSASLSREEIAQREVGHTTAGRSVVRALVAFFLTVIVAVPIGEAIGQHRAGDGRIAGAWRRLLDVPRAVVPVASARGRAALPPSLWQLTVAANRLALAELAAFEDALEDGSVFGRSLRPPAQYVLSGWLGAGNERVYVGNQGWLFYRPDVEYLTGPP
ncbi:MAG TPA: hypothetical protein VLD67_14075, partial [Vicinamibacterales bacterium]|nr:hypothetical protein [Vicinamibacterales bacterium]